MIPLRDSMRPRRAPVVNWLLIVVNVLIFFYSTGLAGTQLEELYFHYGVVPSKVFHLLQTGTSLEPVYLPFLTDMFLHGGWLHIISNMWFLWIFGDNVEDRLGHFRYLLFYLIVGVIGSITHVLANPSSPVPIIGASGAIAGVLGGYLISFPRSRVLTLVPIFFFLTLVEIPAVIFLALWFFLQLFNGALSLGGVANPVAWWAHIGGFVSGFLLIKIMSPGDAKNSN